MLTKSIGNSQLVSLPAILVTVQLRIANHQQQTIYTRLHLSGV